MVRIGSYFCGWLPARRVPFKPQTMAGIKPNARAKSLKLIIFDCDGTLVDSQHMILTAMTAAYGAHGIPLPEREVLLSVIGLSLVEAFTKLGEGLEAFPAATMAEHYREAFHAMRATGAPVAPL